MADNKADKFVGSVRNKETQYGVLTSIGFNEADLEKLKANLKGGWVNLTLKVSQQKGTPYLEIYTGNSNGNQHQSQAQQGDTVRPTKQDVEKNVAAACSDDSDLPF